MAGRDWTEDAYMTKVCHMAMRGSISVLEPIDLRPLLVHSDAAEMLLLARGQLNRAFRTHGLVWPDPLPGGDASCIGSTEREDPAARGIEHARARHGEAFVAWAEAMPRKLARPVLDILWQTHQALDQQRDDSSDASAAVLKAYEFLVSCLQPKISRMVPEQHWAPAGDARPAPAVWG